MSQFGLAVAWAAQFSSLPTRPARIIGHATPLLFQVAVARTFRFDRRTCARYLLAEAIWSTVALVSVGGLIKSVRRSVDRGQAAAQANASLRLAKAKMVADHQAREYGSHSVFRKASSGLKGWIDVAENDPNATVSQLADAEADRLRTFAEPDTYTTESLPLLIAALAAGDGVRVPWNRTGSTGARSNPLHTRASDADRVRRMIESVLDVADLADIRTVIDISDGATSGTLRISAVDSAGTVVVEETFAVEAGRHR